ncbi:hypothetical protein T439DRAFT_378702 [Meredithblackwellia eburnea MCA 4105]
MSRHYSDRPPLPPSRDQFSRGGGSSGGGRPYDDSRSYGRGDYPPYGRDDGYNDRYDSWQDIPEDRRWEERGDGRRGAGGGYRDDREIRYDDYDSRFRGGREEYPNPSRQQRQHGPPDDEPYRRDYHDDRAYGGDPYSQNYHDHDRPRQPPSHSFDQQGPQPYDDMGDHHSSSRRPAAPQVSAEPPSASVVLLGLPHTVDDSTLRAFLEEMGASVDSTTVIFDRTSGESKRYGFAKFSSVEHARAFVEPNFPVVTWRIRSRPGPDDGMKIKINYSQKTGGWRDDQGAGSRLNDDKRKAADGAGAPAGFYVNDGTRDIGSAPTSILLLRGLDPLTNEEEVVQVLSSMTGRAGNEIRDAGGIKKVLLVKDRSSKTSWGYAFIQFSDVRLATEVLGNAFNVNIYPTGFRIRNTIVALSFSHENSFVPIYARSEWSFKGEGGQQLAYWDDKAFVNAWIPPSTATLKQPAAAKSPAPAQKNTTDSDADMEAFFSSLEAEITPLPAPSTTSTQPSISAPPESLPPAPAPAPATSSKTLGLLAPGAPGSISIKLKTANIGGDTEDKSKLLSKTRKQKEEDPAAIAAAAAELSDKKKGELIYSRKAAPNIAKWNVKQQELAQGDQAPEQPTALSTSNATSIPPTPIPSSSAPQPSPAIGAARTTPLSDEFEYADTSAFICLLCSRQFKGLPEVAKHNSLSQLHKTNLANEKLVELAKTKKAERVSGTGGGGASTSGPASATPKYVDRAAARREAFNQPDHPMPDPKRRKVDNLPPPPPPPPVQPNKNGIEGSNVGAKMLEKMGWSKGDGLGATGSGITAPIQASQFQQGAGLGATKGVAVGEFDNNPKGYKEQLREKARARLEESSKQ